MKRISKISALIFAVIASLIMALPVGAVAEAGKEYSAVGLTTASNKVDISKCKITYSKSVSYTGNALKPKVTVKYGKKTLKSGTHYKVKYSSNKKIGTAKITITGISKKGYTGSKTVSFKIVPAKPSVKVSNKTTSSATLSWNKVKGANKYIIYRYSSNKYKKVATISKTSYTVKKLSSATKYTYVVKAYAKKDYTSAYSKKASFYTLPDAVKGLKASAKETSATLSWNKVSKASGYIVYKVENSKYTQVAKTKNTSYTVSKLSSGKKYTYAVAAYVSKTSYLGAKTAVSFTTTVKVPTTEAPKPSVPDVTVPDTTVPDSGNNTPSAALKAPTDLKVVAYNETSMNIKWSAVTGAHYYNVYTYNKSTNQYEKLGDSTRALFIASNLEKGNSYSFAVTAVKKTENGDIESSKSNSITAYSTKNMPANLKKTHDLFRSGTFGITYAIPYDDGKEISTETYVKGNNLLLVANMGVEGLDLTAKTIYIDKDKKGYIIVPFGLTGFYSAMTEAEFKQEGIDSQSLVKSMAPDINEEIPYTVETKLYNGKMCTCEGFVSKSGKVMSYYFYNNTLVGIEEMSAGESPTVMKITKLSSTVDDKIFKLPTGFPFGWTDISGL